MLIFIQSLFIRIGFSIFVSVSVSQCNPLFILLGISTFSDRFRLLCRGRGAAQRGLGPYGVPLIRRGGLLSRSLLRRERSSCLPPGGRRLRRCLISSDITCFISYQLLRRPHAIRSFPVVSIGFRREGNNQLKRYVQSSVIMDICLIPNGLNVFPCKTITCNKLCFSQHL